MSDRNDELMGEPDDKFSGFGIEEDDELLIPGAEEEESEEDELDATGMHIEGEEPEDETQ